MAAVQVGWILPKGAAEKAQRASFVAQVRQSLDVIKDHFASAWVTDHLQFDDNDTLEAWTTLTYFTALYPQFTFGHGVLCQSFRNPALLAKMVATLQYLSNGHFMLGIGAGWKEDEYLAYGYDFPAARIRIEQLEEALQIMKALWTSERASVQGRHYQVSEAWCEPKPEPLPPIMIGGAKPRMLRLIARHADWWTVVSTDLQTYQAQVAACEEACKAVGREPSTLHRAWFGGCICAPTEAQAQALNPHHPHNPLHAFIGTPEQVTEQMQLLINLGIDYFMLYSGDFPATTTLSLLVDEILPVLRRNEARGADGSRR
jgi:alkanesulfonate monooxygenase SsuD/methylene tetrahydromethanopterin reductase-like flavin-dependent oxidoreductase (luciferase family)